MVSENNSEPFPMSREQYEMWTTPVGIFGTDALWWLMKQYPRTLRELKSLGILETTIRELDCKARKRYVELVKVYPQNEAQSMTMSEIVYTLTPSRLPIWAQIAAENYYDMEL
jgi:hypothetical protein